MKKKLLSAKRDAKRSLYLRKYMFHLLHSKVFGDTPYVETFAFNAFVSKLGGKSKGLITQKELEILYRETFGEKFPKVRLYDEIVKEKVVVENKPENSLSTLPPYKGPSLRKRSDKLLRVIGFAGEVPYLPKGTKYKQIRIWIEKIRDKFEKRGQFLTAPALRGIVLLSGMDSAKSTLICNKIDVLLAEEMIQNRRNVAAMIAKANAPRDETTNRRKVERDRFGNKLGTKAATINAVLTEKSKSVKRIARDSKQKGVTGHLNSLVKLKLISRVKKRLDNGEYQTRYKLKGEAVKTPNPKKIRKK